MRNCPVCSISLTEEKMHDICVDRCAQCGGIYFDKGELESLVHIIELYNKLPLPEADIASVPEVEIRRQVNCPVDGSWMEPKELVGLTLDICPDCHGIWLDNGEIYTLKVTERHIKDNIQLYIRLGN